MCLENICGLEGGAGEASGAGDIRISRVNNNVLTPKYILLTNYTKKPEKTKNHHPTPYLNSILITYLQTE